MEAARSTIRAMVARECTWPENIMFTSDGYNGHIRMKGKMDGQDVDMTQQIAARRSGACTAP